jgi:hypothetical protein
MEELFSNWHKLINMAQNVRHYSHQVSPPRRYNNLLNDFSRAGYKCEMKKEKAGRVEQVSFRHPETKEHLRVRFQPLRNSIGSVVRIIHPSDLDTALTTLKEKLPTSPTVSTGPRSIMGGQMSSDPLKAAIRSIYHGQTETRSLWPLSGTSPDHSYD